MFLACSPNTLREGNNFLGTKKPRRNEFATELDNQPKNYLYYCLLLLVVAAPLLLLALFVATVLLEVDVLVLLCTWSLLLLSLDWAATDLWVLAAGAEVLVALFSICLPWVTLLLLLGAVVFWVLPTSDLPLEDLWIVAFLLLPELLWETVVDLSVLLFLELAVLDGSFL